MQKSTSQKIAKLTLYSAVLVLVLYLVSTFFYRSLLHFSLLLLGFTFLFYFLVSKEKKVKSTFFSLVAFSLSTQYILLLLKPFIDTLSRIEVVPLFVYFVLYVLGATYFTFFKGINKKIHEAFKNVGESIRQNTYLHMAKSILFFSMVLIIISYLISIPVTLKINCDHGTSFSCVLSRVFHNHDLFYTYRELSEDNERLRRENYREKRKLQEANTNGVIIPNQVYTSTLYKEMNGLTLEAEYPVFNFGSVLSVHIQGLENESEDEALSNFVASQLVGNVSDIWLNQEDAVLFIAEGDFESYDGYVTVTKIEYERNILGDRSEYTIKSKEYVYQRYFGMYEGISMVDYYPESNTLVFITASGDGCGGQIKVYSLQTDSKNARLINTFGAGCVDGDRFGGMYNRKIIGATVDSNQEYQFPDTRILTSLYLLDPVSLEKTVLPFDYDDVGYASLRNNFYTPQNNTEKYLNKILFEVDTHKDSSDPSNKRTTMEYNPESNQLIPFSSL